MGKNITNLNQLHHAAQIGCGVEIFVGTKWHHTSASFVLGWPGQKLWYMFKQRRIRRITKRGKAAESKGQGE